MIDTTRAYLGVAIKYPITIDSGRPALIADFELINQSIRDILSTPVGTRLFLREYGSRIRECLFEPNDEVLEGLLEMCIFEAVRNWEGRTQFVKVTFETSITVVLCTIYHKPLASNEIQSFIYPFYRKLIY